MTITNAAVADYVAGRLDAQDALALELQAARNFRLASQVHAARLSAERAKRRLRDC